MSSTGASSSKVAATNTVEMTPMPTAKNVMPKAIMTKRALLCCNGAAGDGRPSPSSPIASSSISARDTPVNPFLARRGGAAAVRVPPFGPGIGPGRTTAGDLCSAPTRRTVQDRKPAGRQRRKIRFDFMLYPRCTTYYIPTQDPPLSPLQ